MYIIVTINTIRHTLVLKPKKLQLNPKKGPSVTQTFERTKTNGSYLVDQYGRLVQASVTCQIDLCHFLSIIYSLIAT